MRNGVEGEVVEPGEEVVARRRERVYSTMEIG